jgi:hypothetical protein
MSTTQKGNNFEDKVFELLKIELKSERLLVQSKASKIYKKRKYFSKDRSSYVIVDISIECTLHDAFEPSFFFIIECKDYDKPIPVNELEEFYSKIQQITGANVKALFITTASLQKAAFNYARSKKIAIIRILHDEIKWILPRAEETRGISKISTEEVMKALVNQTYFGSSEQFYIYRNDKTYFSFIDMTLDLLKE